MSIKTSPSTPPEPNGNCPECRGNGKIGMYWERCNTCDGTGSTPRKRATMSDIQADLLKLSKTHDLSRVSLRATAELIGQPNMSPGHLQHHFKMLEKRGLLFIDRKAKVQRIGDGRQAIHTMPNGRDVMFIPFKTYKIVDIDGQPAIIDTGETSNE